MIIDRLATGLSESSIFKCEPVPRSGCIFKTAAPIDSIIFVCSSKNRDDCLLIATLGRGPRASVACTRAAA